MPRRGTKTTRIHCMVYGTTEWDERYLALIDTPEFQRLRNIRQLSVARYVYPSETHSRFEHSLGVGHVAGLFAEALHQRHPELEVPVDALRLAGLCHDMGHGPLSHSFDRYLSETRPAPSGVSTKHEVRSAEVLRRLVKRYRLDFREEDVETACDLIQGCCSLRYAQDIISNDVVDADKLDYLARDSAHTIGVRVFELQRFLDHCRVVDGRLTFHADKMFLDLSFVATMRLHMHVRVYQHETARGLEMMALDYFKLVDPPVRDLESFLALTDDACSPDYVELQRLRGNISSDAADAAQRLLGRFSSRDVYRVVSGPSSSSAARDESVVWDESVVGFDTNPVLEATLFTKDLGRTTGGAHPAANLVAPRPRVVQGRWYTKERRDDGG
jgi:HD superfamily phosphohydrolase